MITRGSSWMAPGLLEPMPPGDVNGDRHVGVDDLLGVISYWGQCSPSPSRFCSADVTIDGLVDVEDLLLVISNWQDPYTVEDLLLVISQWNTPCP